MPPQIKDYVDAKTVADPVPTQGSNALVKSGGVYSAIQNFGNVNGAILANTPAEISNKNIIIGLATLQSPGLMSMEDKQKLDNIIPGGTINISGSGVTKNAAAFGFLPTNDASTNDANLQRCLDGGGYILVDVPGTYVIDKTFLVDSNTYIKFGPGVLLKMTRNPSGRGTRHTFLNRGALSGETNEYITIDGLHLDAGTQGGGSDIYSDWIYGQRGYIAMKGISHLVVKNVYITSGSQWYNIHVQQFYDILFENIRIESTKDGIHLGVGKNFTIRNCSFQTDDDAIALNAHDYPTGTCEFGWLENGRIENIEIKSPKNREVGRGIFFIGGSWLDWASGNTYQINGDTAVHDNKVYTTVGATTGEHKVSTYPPTHDFGIQEYPDGLRWLKMQNASATYNSGVRNVSIDTVTYGPNNDVMVFWLEVNGYCRCVYPGSIPPPIENVSLYNIRMMERGNAGFLFTRMPFKNLRIINCQYNISGDGFRISKSFDGNPLEKCSLLISGMGFRWSIRFINKQCRWL